MKKIIIGASVAVVACALTLGYITYSKTNERVLLMANLEALTSPEDGGTWHPGEGSGSTNEPNCISIKSESVFYNPYCFSSEPKIEMVRIYHECFTASMAQTCWDGCVELKYDCLGALKGEPSISGASISC